jgi:DNA-nicking Smr family endonuclease
VSGRGARAIDAGRDLPAGTGRKGGKGGRGHEARDLHDLQRLRDELQRRQAETAMAAAREAGQRRAADAERQAFVRAVGPVTVLSPRGHARVERPRPPPEPRQREADERAALREALSDEVDIASLLLTDDGLSFRRPGIAEDVLTRLRRGQWAIQNQLDLHGLTREEAREALAGFVRSMHRRGQRCVRVVHGKGHGSPGRQPVLKGKVQRWLAQCREVIAFTQASGPQGGAGALIVLLDGRG